jgi:hypothetical protein
MPTVRRPGATKKAQQNKMPGIPANLLIPKGLIPESEPKINLARSQRYPQCSQTAIHNVSPKIVSLFSTTYKQ